MKPRKIRRAAGEADEIIYAHLTQPRGCTQQELQDALDWRQPVTMWIKRKVAERRNMQIETIEDKPKRYLAIPQH